LVAQILYFDSEIIDLTLNRLFHNSKRGKFHYTY
jgi:hypothetical protein